MRLARIALFPMCQASPGRPPLASGHIASMCKDLAMAHRVVVLALDGVYPFELSIPSRIFGTTDGLYEVVTCSLDGAPVQTAFDFSVTVQHDASAVDTADTLVVPPFV